MQAPMQGSMDVSIPIALRADSLAAPAAKRPYKKRDKATQDKALQLVNDSPAVCTLVEHQQRIDDLINHRRTALREALAKPERLRSRVRITITHVLHAPEANSSVGEPPSWSLIIHGRTLDGEAPQAQPGLNQALVNAALVDSIRNGTTDAATAARLQQALAANMATTGAAAGAAASSNVKHPLTSVLRKAEIKLQPPPSQEAQPSTAMETDDPTGAGPSQQPADSDRAAAASTSGDGSGSTAGRVLVWDRGLHTGAHKDSLEVRFRAVEPFAGGAVASITLTVDTQPERYVLPTPLDTLLGTLTETKPRVLQLVSQYIKQQRLMDADQMVTFKGTWAEVWGTSAMSYQQLQQEVLRRLLPLPPLQATHTISPPGRGPASATVFDIEVDTLAPLNAVQERQAHALLEGLNPDKELEPIEAEMSAVLRRLAEHRRRRAMLLGLAQSPVDFTASILATQARDLRIVKGTSLVPIAQNVQLAVQTNKLTPAQLENAVATAAAGVAKEFEVQRRTDVFKGKWVEDAVVGYLAKRQLNHAPRQY